MTAEVRPIRPDVVVGEPAPRRRFFRAVVSSYEDDDLCGTIELDLVDRWNGDSGAAAAWIADTFRAFTAQDCRVAGGYLYDQP